MFGKNEFRNGLDKELAGIGKEIRLIDSFRFVNRSFRDIGDEFIINPTPIISYLKENQNSSFYDVVGSLLSSNNFDFIPSKTRLSQVGFFYFRFYDSCLRD